jgi:hypothetical protein
MGRAQAEARFTETFTFFTEEESTDPVSLEPTTVETVVSAGVEGRVKNATTEGRDVESGGQFPVLSKLEVHVAVGSVDVADGVHVRVTASTVDDGLVGAVYRVSEPPAKGQVTAWRYPVTQVS